MDVQVLLRLAAQTNLLHERHQVVHEVLLHEGRGIRRSLARPLAMAGEVVMVTEPMDRQGVIEAVGGGTWTGVPEGTVIGHVHLHVGSLAEAESFYHRALGFDRTMWSYPGALLMSAGGYHHHLATNTWAPGPAAATDVARLLEWELILPSGGDVEAVAENLRRNGHRLEKTGVGIVAEDPWTTRIHILPER